MEGGGGLDLHCFKREAQQQTLWISLASLARHALVPKWNVSQVDFRSCTSIHHKFVAGLIAPYTCPYCRRRPRYCTENPFIDDYPTSDEAAVLPASLRQANSECMQQIHPTLLKSSTENLALTF